MMPGMTGTEMALVLNTIRPDLPIILLTGHAVALPPDQLRAMGIRKLVAKPLSIQLLAAAVHQVLSTPSASLL
jgi:CheY-like chemotaxis protein